MTGQCDGDSFFSMTVWYSVEVMRSRKHFCI